MLRIEGDDDAAKKVVEEMKKAKVQTNESNKGNNPARGKVLGKLLTAKLAGLFYFFIFIWAFACFKMIDHCSLRCFVGLPMVENGVAASHSFRPLQLNAQIVHDEIF